MRYVRGRLLCLFGKHIFETASCSLSVCFGLQIQVYDSCQDALDQLDFAASDGHYWVDHKNLTEPQIVYCDMENGGYELVYKVVHGGGVTDAYTLWTGMHVLLVLLGSLPSGD